MLVVWAVDADHVRRGHLEPLSCSVVVRDCDVGTWSLSVRDDDLARRVVEGWRLIIVDDGQLIVSGPVVSFGVDVAEDAVTLEGVDDLIHLADRLVYPDPSADAESQTSAAYYKRSGAAETVIRNMIHANVGAGALLDRQAIVVASSAGRGSTVATNLRFKNLLEESRSLARLGGVQFTVAQESDNRIVCRFRVPQDLSRQVRFTPRNGLDSGSYSLAGPTATDVVVAGQGEGTARTILERSQSSLWGRRVELFQDQRDTDDTDELEQSATEVLAEGAASASAVVEVSERPGLKLFKDFVVGDTVTVQFGAATISEPVRAAEIEMDGHGRTVRLSLGDHESEDDQSPAWVKHVRNLNARVRGLETR